MLRFILTAFNQFFLNFCASYAPLKEKSCIRSESVPCTELIKLLVKFNGILYIKYEYASFNSEILDPRHSWVESALLFFLRGFFWFTFALLYQVYRHEIQNNSPYVRTPVIFPSFHCTTQ